MDKLELLLIANGILLALLAGLLGLVGYFLKDLHRDFKKLLERVNELGGEFHLHLKVFDKLSNSYDRRFETVEERVDKIEKKL